MRPMLVHAMVSLLLLRSFHMLEQCCTTDEPIYSKALLMTKEHFRRIRCCFWAACAAT